MFFARLAIAALSFGSVAKVFAAPIAVEGYNVAIPETLPTQRRADLDPSNVLSNAVIKLSEIKSKMAPLTATPAAAAANLEVIKPLLAKVAPTLATISSSLSATGGQEFAQESQDSVAKDLSLVMTTTTDIVNSVKGIKTLAVVLVELEYIKEEIDTILLKVQSLLPTIIKALGLVIAALHNVLSLALPAVGGAVADVASGGI
ncbi:hypothetical protein FRC07_001025 [Ceratobasidium sp. 392]|nr:hypothetical protein FRC07_001025 [Ceratobasidium sp. 392]